MDNNSIQNIAPRAYYSKREAAFLLGMSITTLDRKRVSGELIGVRNGRKIFFLGKELIQYWQSLPAGNRPIPA